MHGTGWLPAKHPASAQSAVLGQVQNGSRMLGEQYPPGPQSLSVRHWLRVRHVLAAGLVLDERHWQGAPPSQSESAKHSS